MADTLPLSPNCRKIADNIRQYTAEFPKLRTEKKRLIREKDYLQTEIEAQEKAIKELEWQAVPAPSLSGMIGDAARIAEATARAASVRRVKLLRTLGNIGQVTAIPADATIEDIRSEASRQLDRARALKRGFERRLPEVERGLDANKARHEEVTELLNEAGQEADENGCDNRVLVWGG